MIIKTQNGEKLIQSDKICEISIDDNTVKCYSGINEYILGVYNSKSRAKEVLNVIFMCFNNSLDIVDKKGNIEIRYKHSVFEMPKE